MPKNLNAEFPFDPIAIGTAISHAFHHSADRSSALGAAAESAFHSAGGRRNVMVCNLALPYQENFNGAWFETFSYHRLRFGVWVFHSGRFVRGGDGGYVNWRFKGNFRRYTEDGRPDGGGNVVEFSPLG